MTVATRSLDNAIWKRAAVAVAATIACAAASAADLPDFTLDPTAFGGSSTFTADNLLISDYSAVTFGGGGSFTDTGYLAVSGVQHNGTVGGGGGLNSTYGLYFAFTGTGTVTPVGGGVSTGNFSSLTYSLYAYSGAPATFGIAGGAATKSATVDTLLASGSLLNGSVTSVSTPGGGLIPSAEATLTFNVAGSAGSFFVSPDPFYNMAFSAFINTVSQVTPTATGFTIDNGGGAINFATAVPEPETYAMVFAGLGALGFLARRRSNGGGNS